MVCYASDTVRNLETARAEGILSGETCSTVLATLPARADVRKVSTQWHAVWRLPTQIAEPNRLTTNAYNGDGGVYCAPTSALVGGNPIGVLCKRTVRETTDATGQSGFAATTTGTPRIWQYTYDAYGQVLTATDPNINVTTTAYYAANDPDLGKRGNVQTVTNPLGHVTTITAYDADGRPTSITDSNGMVTTLAYHPRGWLTSRTVGGETTTYDYDGVGQLGKVTLPDASYVQYTYDAAHRLTQIEDGLGNKVVYTLDAMGNRIKEQAYDPGGTLARTRQQVFDSLNRLHQSVGAQ
jgi:YD repeat-containing protein